MMTPLQIAMMIHYYAIAEPYALHDRAHANSPAVRKQRQQLVDMELLVEAPDSASGYQATEQGRKYVAALQSNGEIIASFRSLVHAISNFTDGDGNERRLIEAQAKAWKVLSPFIGTKKEY